MDQRLQPLFTPWKIGNCEIKNRIVLTSMGGTDLFGWMEKNHFDKDGARFIMEVAKNNAGLVLPGCQPVYNPMFGQWLHKNKKMYADLKKWTPELHKTGAKLFVQLTAGFGRSFTISEMMEKLYTNPALRVLSKPFMDLDKITASASPSPNRWSDKVPSREMTKAEIKEFVNAFAESAKMLKDAGVDGVEVHAVHEGYLLDQFTLKYVNKRTDEYGGSFENRYRFAVEVVQAIKKACGDDFPVSLRYSIISKTKGFRQGALPGEAYTEVGRDMAESEKAVKYLQDAGYDCLNCDNGTYDAWYWAHPPIYMPENCNLEDVEYIKQFCDIPVICAGRLDPRVAADAIKEGKLDGAGFARQFLADQEWVTKMMNDEEDDIRPCILCHNGCFNMCHYKGVPNDQELSDSLHLSRCAINAETMQWNKHYIKKTNERSKEANAMIEFRNVTKSYGDFTAVEDISFSACDSSVCGLIGYNGAGTTTLIKCAAGLYKPDSGKVLIDGESTYNSDEVRSRLFFVPDDLFFPVGSTPNSAARFYKDYYPEFSFGNFERMLKLFELDGDAKIRGFSKGMQRQTEIALALASSPKVLLLDECLDGLDIAKKDICKQLFMDYMAQSGCTMLISSHAIADLQNLCDRIVLISGKRMQMTQKT